MRIWKSAFLLAAAVICVFMLTACGEQEINIPEYVNVEFNGLDGKGTASIIRGNLDSAIEDIISGDADDESVFAKLNMVEKIESSVKLELDKDSELSNGDTVTLRISADNEKAKKIGIKFTGIQNQTFTVSGLKEVTKIDPFDETVFNIESGEGIYIDFTDISPHACIQIRNTLPDSNPLSKVNYHTDTNYVYNIKKGQTINIIADAPYSFEKDGYELTATSTTVTCEKVDEYIRSVDDIDEATMQKIVNQCNDLYESKFESYSNGYDICYKNAEGKSVYREYMESISDFTYQNEYFFVLKDGLERRYGSGMKENGLFITATVNLNNVSYTYGEKTKHNDKDRIIYFYVFDIVKNKDGEIQYKADMVNYGKYIYVDEDVFKAEVVNTYLDSFEKVTEQKAEFK